MVAAALRARRGLALQAIRFAVVGGSNTLVTFAVIWAMRTGLGSPVWLASAVGYGVGMVQGFVLNRFWTFGGGGGRLGTQAVAFVGVNLVCLLVFTGVNVLLHRWFSLPVSSVLATATVMPLSFVLNRSLVFRAVPTIAGSPPPVPPPAPSRS